MRNNKGFTLVEMMAVLVILSLLIGIGIYTVNNIKRGAADNYYVSMEDTLKIAGNDYFTDNRGDRPIDDYNFVNLETLQNHEYLEQLRTYDKKSKCDPTSGVYIYNTDAGTDYEVCLKCGEFSSDGPYCRGEVPGQIMITGKTDLGIPYNPLLSYIGTPWAKANSIDITFKLNTTDAVTKYEIYNSNNNKLYSTCNVTSGNTCTERIGASGSFYVLAYNNTTKVANRKYFNVKIDNTKPTFNFKDKGTIKDLGEGFEFRYINEIINVHDDNGYKSIIYTLKNTNSGVSYATNKDITEENLEIIHNLPSGNYSLYAKVTDYAGNYSEDSFEFQIQYTVNLVFFDNKEIKHEVGSFKVHTGGKYTDLPSEITISGVKHKVDWYDNSSFLGENPYTSETTVSKSSMHTLYGKETRFIIDSKNFPHCNNENEFMYNGVNQTLVSGYTGYTLTNNVQKNAGTYTIIAMPDADYVWEGGSRTYKVIQCTIKPYPVTVTAVDQKKIYDGYALKANTDCTITEMPANHKHSCTHSGERTDVGETPKVITKVTIKQNGRDETANFDITQVDGTLKITPRIITVTADNQEKTYDGKPLNANTSCTVTSDMKLASGQKKACTHTGTITLAGTEPKVLTDVKITKSDGTDVTYNYEITKVNGTLKINPKPVTVTATDQSKQYDGTALEANDVCTIKYAASGDKMTCDTSGSRTTVGTTTKKIESITIKNGSGTDVTTSYDITPTNGTLEVKKRKLKYRAKNQK